MCETGDRNTPSAVILSAVNAGMILEHMRYGSETFWVSEIFWISEWKRRGNT
jgi:hypothetical protein